MRLLIHDYGGYALTIPLSRELARRGHTVLHLYAGYNTIPRGLLERREGDPAGLEFEALYTRQPLDKYSFVRRWQQEREYGRLLAGVIRQWRPQAVLSANTPLDAQAQALAAAREVGARFVFWLQDLLGEAAWRILRRKMPLVGKLVGGYYRALEARLARASDHLVLISADFQPRVAAWGVPSGQVSVIPNWAPLDDLPVSPKANPWSCQALDGGALSLAEQFVYLYTGSLALKHNPGLLLALAQRVQALPARVVVVSEGPGADWLRKQADGLGVNNLHILNYQPYERLAQVLATADVLVAVLDAEAGAFSVPSKVLSYLCAGRPLLLAVPPENLAGRIVREAQAGVVVSPQDEEGFLAAAVALAQDGAQREAMGRAGRAYAESHFAIQPLADQFEMVCLPQNEV